MILDATQIEAINEHALKSHPAEACGVIKAGAYVPLENIAPNPEQAFAFSAKRQKELMPFDAVVHSHPDWYACPSEADMRTQASMGLPWVIVATDGMRVSTPLIFGDCVPRQPLEGRGFIHGVTDCYSLIRDWYLEKRDLDLPDFPRDWEWWLPEVVNADGETVTRAVFGPNGLRFEIDDEKYVAPFAGVFPLAYEGFEIRANLDLYKKGYEAAGFEVLAEGVEQQEGDVVLFQLPRMPAACHGGVYLGNGLLLHHLTATKAVDPSRLSVVEPIAKYGNCVVSWLRHS